MSFFTTSLQLFAKRRIYEIFLLSTLQSCKATRK